MLVAQTIQTNFEAIMLTISELLAQLGEEGPGFVLFFDIVNFFDRKKLWQKYKI